MSQRIKVISVGSDYVNTDEKIAPSLLKEIKVKDYNQGIWLVRVLYPMKDENTGLGTHKVLIEEEFKGTLDEASKRGDELLQMNSHVIVDYYEVKYIPNYKKGKIKLKLKGDEEIVEADDFIEEDFDVATEEEEDIVSEELVEDDESEDSDDDSKKTKKVKKQKMPKVSKVKEPKAPKKVKKESTLEEHLKKGQEQALQGKGSSSKEVKSKLRDKAKNTSVKPEKLKKEVTKVEKKDKLSKKDPKTKSDSKKSAVKESSKSDKSSKGNPKSAKPTKSTKKKAKKVLKKKKIK